MALVMTYWCFPDEEKGFLDFLETTGDVVAIPSWGVRKKEDFVPQRPADFIKQFDPNRILLGLKEHVGHMVVKPYGDKGEQLFSVDLMASCLVAYDRGKFRDGHKLGSSNLCAYFSFPNEDATMLIDKAPEFVLWTKRVYSWVTQATPEWHRDKDWRVTSRVAQAIREGLEIVL